MKVQQTSLNSYWEVIPDLGERQMQVYACLQALGRATNLMIAKHAGLEINVVTPRIHELRSYGLVQEAFVDACKVSKRKAIYWRCKR